MIPLGGLGEICGLVRLSTSRDQSVHIIKGQPDDRSA